MRKTEININVTGKELVDIIKGLKEKEKEEEEEEVDVGDLASAINERVKRKIGEHQSFIITAKNN